jgi:hypothetical protein
MSSELQVRSNSAAVLLVTDGGSARSEVVRSVLIPVFRFWGLPIRSADSAYPLPQGFGPADIAVIILAQEELDPSRLNRLAGFLEEATAHGAASWFAILPSR